MTRHAHIVMDGPGHGRLWLDGVELKQIASFELKARVGEMNTLVVEFLLNTVELEGPVEVLAQIAALESVSLGVTHAQSSPEA